MVSKLTLALVVLSCLVVIECAPQNVMTNHLVGVKSEPGELKIDKRADAPWWCNAAVTKCNGGEDSCCYGYWASPRDACRAACAQCGRSC